MSLFSDPIGSVAGFLGLTPDLGDAAQSAQFNPYNINQSFGSLSYDPESRSFTSQLNPHLQGIQQSLFSQYGKTDPMQQLGLMRQQAQPYNEAMGQGIENRLFSQGLMGASKEYQPGGQMRGFWDSVLNQDMGFQLSAQQQAQQAQQNYLNQLLGLGNLEQGLFGNVTNLGSVQTGAGANVANIQATGAMALPNLIGSLGGGAIQGIMSK
jgi:hypothetical protein